MKRMYAALLLLWSLSLSACSQAVEVTAPSQPTPSTTTSTTVAEEVPVTTTMPPTTTTTEPATTTTTFVDRANPLSHSIIGLEPITDVAIDPVGPGFGQDYVPDGRPCALPAWEACEGRVDWWQEAEYFVGPCETGVVSMIGHVNGDNPYKSLMKAKGGMTVKFLLEDNSECEYTITPFPELAVGMPSPESDIAWRFEKDYLAETNWEILLKAASDRNILFLWTSGGNCPEDCVERNGGMHRIYNDILIAELSEEG